MEEVIVSSNQFEFDYEYRIMVGELSDMKYYITQVHTHKFDSSLTPQLKVMMEDTKEVVTFRLGKRKFVDTACHSDTIFLPTPESVSSRPSLSGWIMVLYND